MPVGALRCKRPYGTGLSAALHGSVRSGLKPDLTEPCRAATISRPSAILAARSRLRLALPLLAYGLQDDILATSTIKMCPAGGTLYASFNLARI
jgi:hypothetical protein